MRYQISCGIIPIYRDDNNSIKFLLVQGYGGYWGFPKGRKEKHESDQQTAIRELYEETKLTCNSIVKNVVFSERYRIPKKRNTDIIKKVRYFIGIIDSQSVIIQKSELKKYGWFSYDQAQQKLTEKRQKILLQALNEINN